SYTPPALDPAKVEGLHALVLDPAKRAGMDKLPAGAVDEKQLRRIEAIILSMTPLERRKPEVLNAKRRQRIARGSGTTVTQVNDLLLRFNQMRKMMKNMGRLKKMLGGMGGKPGGLKFPAGFPN
ncbi:MAG: hypothetical protein N2322_05950, partial [Terrimicrobiaceae bacterium]|nr:hypothetical protein [Terrimicrobiaceae bacterium]